MATTTVTEGSTSSCREMREFDVTVFGASGFTGQRILQELLWLNDEENCAALCGLSESLSASGRRAPYPPLRLAAAGRSRSRLEAALATAQMAARQAVHAASATCPHPHPHASSPPAPSPPGASLVLADVSDEASLLAMAARTRLLITAVGPYRLYGLPVVRACVSTGTHYVDVSGEPEFMERVAAQFHSPALQAHTLLLSACGFDSVPADLGCSHVLSSLPDTLHSSSAISIHSYLSLSAPEGFTGNFATWESLVHGLAAVEQLRKFRQVASSSLTPRPPPSPFNQTALSFLKADAARSRPSSSYSLSPLLRLLPSSFTSHLPHWSPTLAAWVLPFPGADASVVRRSLASHSASHHQQLRFSASAPMPDFEGAPVKQESFQETSLLLAADAASPFSSSSHSSPSPPVVKYSAFFTVPTTFYASLFVAFGSIIQLMAQLPIGRRLLLTYPRLFSCGLFSHQGPTEEQMACASFRMHFHVRAFSAATLVAQAASSSTAPGSGPTASHCSAPDLPPPDCVAETSVTGPEPGYVATPRIVVACALQILFHRDSMPQGGVLTPAVAFQKCGTLTEALSLRGVQFNVLDVHMKRV